MEIALPKDKQVAPWKNGIRKKDIHLPTFDGDMSQWLSPSYSYVGLDAVGLQLLKQDRLQGLSIPTNPAQYQYPKETHLPKQMLCTRAVRKLQKKHVEIID